MPSTSAPKSFSRASGEVSWSHQRATVGSLSHFASSGKSSRVNRTKVIGPTPSAYEGAPPGFGSMASPSGLATTTV